MYKDKYKDLKRIFFRIKCLEQRFPSHLDSFERTTSLHQIAKEELNKGLLEYIKVVPRVDL